MAGFALENGSTNDDGVKDKVTKHIIVLTRWTLSRSQLRFLLLHLRASAKNVAILIVKGWLNIIEHFHGSVPTCAPASAASTRAAEAAEKAPESPSCS